MNTGIVTSEEINTMILHTPGKMFKGKNLNAINKIIKELADTESVVIVGRCSDYILRDRENCLNVLQKEYQGSFVLCYQSS